MSERILTIKVGTGVQSSLALAQQMMERLEVGEEPAPYYGVGFKTVSQMLGVFTPPSVGICWQPCANMAQ